MASQEPLWPSVNTPSLPPSRSVSVMLSLSLYTHTHARACAHTVLLYLIKPECHFSFHRMHFSAHACAPSLRPPPSHRSPSGMDGSGAQGDRSQHPWDSIPSTHIHMRLRLLPGVNKSFIFISLHFFLSHIYKSDTLSLFHSYQPECDLLKSAFRLDSENSNR